MSDSAYDYDADGNWSWQDQADPSLVRIVLHMWVDQLCELANGSNPPLEDIEDATTFLLGVQWDTMPQLLSGE